MTKRPGEHEDPDHARTTERLPPSPVPRGPAGPIEGPTILLGGTGRPAGGAAADPPSNDRFTPASGAEASGGGGPATPPYISSVDVPGGSTAPETLRPATATATPPPSTRTADIGGTPTVIEPGRILFGKYIVLRLLGRGGMGEVWQVRHRELDSDRALKLIVPHIAFDDQMRARFKREARVMARFTHPNAVAVHDAGVGGQAAFIEMEYVRGQSLNHLLRPGVPMPLPWVGRILGQLCDVLQVAHDQGIVHRDLKPSNLMLLDGLPPGQEHLKVLDFGIAKILGGDEEAEELSTRTGVFVGTAQYSSPEQACGGPVDARSDLYTVGVMLYEFLTGHRPFGGAKLVYDHICTPPPPFALKNPDAEVPPEVEALVLRALSKDPAGRPQSARELADEFRRITTPPPPEFEEPPPPVPPWRFALWAVAGLILGLVAVMVALRHWPGAVEVRLVPEALSVRAGGEETVSLVISGDRFAGPSRPDPVDGAGLAITRLADECTRSTDRYRIRIDPAARAGTKTLVFRVPARGRELRASLPLTIRPPEVYLPPNYDREPGAKLVPVAGKFCPDRIVRTFPDGTRVVFLLIPKRRPEDPEPFYIMEHKVWNTLFDLFARGRAGVTHFEWQARAIKDGRFPKDPPGRWPVMNVTAKEAHEFASQWLGGLLPTCQQWDKAAGLLDSPADSEAGPFLPPWVPGDPTQIAVARLLPGELFDDAEVAARRDLVGPIEVGGGSRDISPYGCRDMAGNGREWTRNVSSDLAETIPPATNSAYTNVFLRGRSYIAQTPLTYKLLRKRTHGDSERYLEAFHDIGFRVVIEIRP